MVMVAYQDVTIKSYSEPLRAARRGEIVRLSTPRFKNVIPRSREVDAGCASHREENGARYIKHKPNMFLYLAQGDVHNLFVFCIDATRPPGPLNGRNHSSG
jgi:hypothetical protein